MYIRRLKSQICDEETSTVEDLNLGTLDQVIESQLFQGLYGSVKRVIQEKLQYYSEDPEANSIKIKRMSMYLNDSTKSSSLILRLASILSLHSLEDFQFDEEELELAMKSANLDADGFLSVPDDMVAAGYVVTKRMSIYDDLCSLKDAKISALSRDSELMIV